MTFVVTMFTKKTKELVSFGMKTNKGNKGRQSGSFQTFVGWYLHHLLQEPNIFLSSKTMQLATK
jgi:hypothetical protein